jgi:hypothetical protein
MKTSFVFLEILVFVSLWHNSQGKLWNGRKNNNNNNEKTGSHPRRRLTELTPETVGVDAATGAIKSDDPNNNCDGQLAQALVAANDKEFQAKQARDQALKEKAVAMEELRQLQLMNKSLKDTVDKLEVEVKTLHQQDNPDARTDMEESIVELKQMLRTKDDMIAKLQAELDANNEEKQKQLEEKLAKALEEVKAEHQTQLEDQRKVSEQLLETTREEAKRVLLENVATIKDQMKESEKKFKQTLAEKDEVIKQVKAQNERFSKFNQEMLETAEAHEKVGALTSLSRCMVKGNML